MKTADNRHLDDDIADTIGQGLIPVKPPPLRQAALRQRILQRAGSGATPAERPHSTVRTVDGVWEEIAPRVAMKVLFRDAQAEAVLYRLGPGAALPPHEHPADEECMMLEGEMWIGDLRLSAGDFHLARSGIGHGETRSSSGALLYVRRGLVESRGGA